MASRSLASLVLLIGLFVPFLLVPEIAYAVGTFKDGFSLVDSFRATMKIKEFTSIGDFIIAILKVGASLVAVLALAALLYGAIMYITSLGDESKTSTAKKIILYAIVGLIVLGAAGIVVNVAINLISD